MAYTGKAGGRPAFFDSSEGRDPIAFTAGGAEVIPGIGEGVIGMELGEKKDADHPRQSRRTASASKRRSARFPRSAIPEDASVGDQLVAESPDKSERHMFFVVELGDEQAVIDGNHPLAGKTLVFDVEIVGVEGGLIPRGWRYDRRHAPSTSAACPRSAMRSRCLAIMLPSQ